jgi:hypothetical protein
MADERTAADVAEALRNGGWWLWPWDRIGPNSDLAEWKASIEALCEEMSVGIDFIDVESKSVTVVFNLAAVPSYEAVRDLIVKLCRARWLRRGPT